MATQTATRAYRDRFHESFARTYYRRFDDYLVSSIGIGTYLGDATDRVDGQYHDALVAALNNGVNVIDTAINYRHQRSERVIGDALPAADPDRDAIFIATKGGFVPFDTERPSDAAEYIADTFLDTGLIDRHDLVMGHCLAPEFIEWSLTQSLQNMDLDSLDLYYIHNPEAQLREFSPETVYSRLEDAFTSLETRVDHGDIRHYGIATWEAFRVPPDHEKYLSLPRVIERAEAAADRAGNEATHFRAIQLPFNIHMADAFTRQVHDESAEKRSTLDAAREAGINVFTSATLLQGDLTIADNIPDAVDAKLAGGSPAQRAINFARSAPGVTCALVGSRSATHMKENIGAGRFAPLGAAAFNNIFQ